MNSKQMLRLLMAAAVIVIGYFAAQELFTEKQPEVLKIGVVNLSPALNPVFEGIKMEMETLGYKEGQEVTYLYNGPVRKIENLDTAYQTFRQNPVDLLFALSTPAAIKAKQHFGGSETPIVFAPVYDPVKSGIVKSVLQPGGNITGVKAADFVAKGLEWLSKISPDRKKVLVFHNPKDQSSVLGLTELLTATDQQDFQIILEKISTLEEIDSILQRRIQDIEIIFILPDNLVSAHTAQIVSMANEHSIPVFASAPSLGKAGAMIAFGPDFIDIGKQVARIAHQTLQGTTPAELPVESAEFYLVLNLKTAKKIGIEIPEVIVRQADRVIR